VAGGSVARGLARAGHSTPADHAAAGAVSRGTWRPPRAGMARHAWRTRRCAAQPARHSGARRPRRGLAWRAPYPDRSVTFHV